MGSDTDYPQLIHQFVSDERLPETYQDDAICWFLPLKDQILAQVRSQPGKLQIIGINGAQGTGKSTLAKLLQRLLQEDGLSVVSLSIDDFYYSTKVRDSLATEIHPLLKSRGVPGTHDIGLAINTLSTLKNLSAIEELPLPAFDKSTDEPVPFDEWIHVSGPVNVVILEGWFVGASQENEGALAKPVNRLEQEEDKAGVWRQYVNQQLGKDYQTLFAMLSQLVLLKAPDFDQVYQWRALQEERLRESRESGAGIMGEETLTRFIQHFERLTRHCLSTLPKKADVIFELDKDHRISKSSLIN